MSTEIPTHEEQQEYARGLRHGILGQPREPGHRMDSWYEAGYANGQTERYASREYDPQE